MDQCRIFVINLDSCKDRLDYMEKLMNGKHLTFERVVAEDLPYAVVLEDDITLYEDFSERLQEVLKVIPPEADFISINQRVLGDKSLKTSEVQFLRLCSSRTTRVMFTGTYWYIITNQGAKKLLASTDQGCFPIDVIIPMSYFDNKINSMGRCAWNEIREKAEMILRKKSEALQKKKSHKSQTLALFVA